MLDEEVLVNKARGLGLSCITEEDKERQLELSRRTGANLNTTRGFSTVPGGKDDKPLEIRIAFPAFHSRAKLNKKVEPIYEGTYREERTQEVLGFSDQVHWKINQQHPVVPRGARLVKLQDYLDRDGRRIVSYVPEKLKDIYDNELGEVESTGPE